jgi:hypothetical protein
MGGGAWVELHYINIDAKVLVERTFCSSQVRLLPAAVRVAKTWAPQGQSAPGEGYTSLH